MNIVMGGEAGQGLVTVGRLLSKILVRQGYSIVVTQGYQSRIRGGHNTFAVRVSPDAIEAPTEAIDLLVALDDETVTLHAAELAPSGLVIADDTFCDSDERCLRVPFKDLAPAQFKNTAALGVLCAVLGLDVEAVAGSVGEVFGAAHPEMAEGNRAAIQHAFAWFGGKESRARRLPGAAARPARLMLDGNQAIALGAVSAGLRFVSFYPMTPSTSVPLTVIDVAERMGIVVEQAEDEIAAINMAIGASFAGAPSMVATSGGGFALMVEGVSLAGMTETPVVIVVGQRPAPATGLPTRTEQADLEFVLHAGHGEFPRAIFAPGTVEQCFHLARRSMFLAERYQGPVFILTDQFLADSYRAVEPFDAAGLDWVRPGMDPAPVDAPYRRHAVTSNGVSPRLLPGASDHLVVTDSDEHTEDGHLTEDLGVRKIMVDKRLRKLGGIRGEVVAPEYEGSGRPELLLVSWGSTRGAVREAAAAIRANGVDAATLHFTQVWPLAAEQFIDRLERASGVVCVEGNATGQLARLIRRETGFAIEDRVSRYDGLPITSGFILRELSV
ncbi:MAG: 2-oxoacid:acceptor oxidoreductase subunit alpha [Candidatus Krumholzibacteria bacterium]|nr:2-oxoacid:acceptor oxidoreductase subunit alpha [Candidatus Krumholzibacteria bacterium]